jgi:phosphopantothenoylcysteine decarboxylase / phosphopantothenate---cysteine ligase
MSNSKILFAVSGSIACMKAASAVSLAVQKGFDVQVVATPSALKFVGSATWEGLTNRPVISDAFQEGHQMDHIHLARWADVLILCPASSNAIGNWANGLAPDLPSTMFLAFERTKPVLVAPAMNKEMWAHPSVQKNIEILRGWNLQMIEPEEGSLACGEIGSGRLASPEKIVAAIETALKPSKGHIVITSGATREPIDGVRFLTNFSSGKTGAFLADHFAGHGYDVTYLHGIGAALPQNSNITKTSFEDFCSLKSALPEVLNQKPTKAILCAAAVSDFSVASVENEKGKAALVGEKLKSDQVLNLKLTENPKLVLLLKEWSKHPDLKVIAFKLTSTKDPAERKSAVDRLLTRPEIDFVVGNDLSGISETLHEGFIYKKTAKKNASATFFKTKQEMANLIEGLMEEPVQ